MFDTITVMHTPGIPNIKQGDIFETRFDGINFNANLCQIKALPVDTHVNKSSMPMELKIVKYKQKIKKEVISLEEDKV